MTNAVASNVEEKENMCIILPFTDMKVNLYNYTVINKLKETRLLLRVDNR